MLIGQIRQFTFTPVAFRHVPSLPEAICEHVNPRISWGGSSVYSPQNCSEFKFCGQATGKIISCEIFSINVDSLPLTELERDSTKCTHAETDNPVIHIKEKEILLGKSYVMLLSGTRASCSH